MRRGVGRALLAALVSAILAGSSAAAADVEGVLGWRTHVDTPDGFRIDIPSRWQVVPPTVKGVTQREGRIVFAFGESGDVHPAQVAVMDGNGKHRRQLPLDHVFGGSWSPDGRSVAVDLVGPGRDLTSRRDVWTVNVDGRGAPRRVVRNGFTPDWSPNGRSIAFQRGGTTFRGGDIWVVEVNGGGQRRLIRRGRWPRWSPDGKMVAFERGGSRTDIWVADVRTKKERLLARHGESAVWSPDGRQVAFDRCPTEGLTSCFVYVMRANGTAQRRLFQGAEPRWSPNGQEIVFVGADARRHFYDAIFRRRVNGSGRRVLFARRPYCGCYLLAWAPPGHARR